MDANNTLAEYRAMRALKEKIQKENAEDYQQASRERLFKIIENKMKTCFIGALDKFEKKFGELWGHGKTELTEEEHLMKELWDECRTSILDNGHTQIRNIKKELELNTVHWDRYTMTFPVKEKKEG